MLALTVWQPWAQLLAIGAKRFETRGWPTPYRGPLAIHAGLQWRGGEAVLCWRSPFREALEAAGVAVPPQALATSVRRFPRILPLGAVVAVAELADVIECWPHPEGLTREELLFGDWGPGRFAWEIRNPVLLPEPIPLAGHQGLHPIPVGPRAAIDRQVQEVANGR